MVRRVEASWNPQIEELKAHRNHERRVLDLLMDDGWKMLMWREEASYWQKIWAKGSVRSQYCPFDEALKKRLDRS
jgi:hypothetical protein